MGWDTRRGEDVVEEIPWGNVDGKEEGELVEGGKMISVEVRMGGSGISCIDVRTEQCED